MRTRYNKRRFRTAIMIFVLLLCMSIGYSYLLTTLNIEGTSNIKANTWDVHWENISVKSGSVTGDQVPIAAHVMSDTTQVEYSVILKNPGEYYEFTVDAKNSGSLDAMVSITDTKFYEENGVTEINLPDYLEYEFLYSNGVRIGPNQILAANSSRTIKVKIKFKDNLDASELPTTDKTIVIRQSITYVQADDTAIEAPGTRFEQDSWSEIVDNVHNANTDYYNVGDTKEVDMGSFGTHKLRIANKSTPSECNNSDFSQTACGFVLEFEDVITHHRMNPYEFDVTTPGNGNIGGWPLCEMRSFINNDVYNAFPSVLKNEIVLTNVISGHGSTTGETNFATYDHLYLLDVKEVYGESYTSSNNTAKDYERQLDYYKSKNVTTSNYSEAIKKSNGSNNAWSLRSAFAANAYFFFEVSLYGSLNNSYSHYNYGVSPSFRIGR